MTDNSSPSFLIDAINLPSTPKEAWDWWASALDFHFQGCNDNEFESFKTIAELVDMEKLSVTLANEVPFIYKAGFFFPAFQFMLDQGATFPATHSTKNQLSMQTWLLGEWRKRAEYEFAGLLRKIDTTKPTLFYRCRTENLIKTISLLFRARPESFAEGVPDLHGRRQLSFLHSVLWSLRDDTMGFCLMKGLIDAGLPVCNDVMGDSKYLKGKLPCTVSLIERELLAQEALKISSGASSLKRKI